jgi:ribose/xylose/arabinose/galactoside ABC-type transport system permease subunit
LRPSAASFIVTLGMMQIARGVAKGIAQQTTVNTPDNWLNGLMVVEPSPGCWYSVAPAVWIMLVLLGLMFVVLRYTVFGRYIFAIGSNESTARLCGIRVGLQRVAIYAACGLLTGVAGVMQFSNLTLGDPTAANGMELDIIAAVVIGGGSLSGGEGSAVGSIVGALIMAILRNGCTLVGIPNYVQNIVIGVIIIVAVGIDRLKHARRT